METNKFYLYIDDSGKFNTKNDKHVIYSFILFDKFGRKKFVSQASKAKDKIYDQKKELHGNEFIRRLNKLKKDPHKKANFEFLIKCYECSIVCGSVIWCKNISSSSTENLNINQELNKKIRMISIILKKIHENKFIDSNSFIKIYLDNEKIVKDEKPNTIKEILNKDFSNFSGDIRYLRSKKIYIGNVEYLDSEKSLPIQFADIIANVTHKKCNNETDKIKLFFELFNTYSETIYVIFPGYKYNNNIYTLSCECFNLDHRN